MHNVRNINVLHRRIGFLAEYMACGVCFGSLYNLITPVLSILNQPIIEWAELFFGIFGLIIGCVIAGQYEQKEYKIRNKVIFDMDIDIS